MKVTTQFYCIQEKKTYNIGSEYKGKRQDLGSFLEDSKPKKKSKQK